MSEVLRQELRPGLKKKSQDVEEAFYKVLTTSGEPTALYGMFFGVLYAFDAMENDYIKVKAELAELKARLESSKPA